MVGLGTTELLIIAGLVLVMGLFWGVLAFVLGWSFLTRGKQPPATPPRTSRDGDGPHDGADDAR